MDTAFRRSAGRVVSSRTVSRTIGLAMEIFNLLGMPWSTVWARHSVRFPDPAIQVFVVPFVVMG